MITKRTYRDDFASDLEKHQIVVGETDLLICLPASVWDDFLAAAVRARLIEVRSQLQLFISENPLFAETHHPLQLASDAPLIARKMAAAARQAGVGPMAAVAGYFSELVGRFIIKEKQVSSIVVENGGDIFLSAKEERLIGIYAGESSPFSNRLAIRLKAEQLPTGICTSSGTFGSSFSYGKADAAVVVAADTCLADAVATAAANLVQEPADVEPSCNFAMGIAGVDAALIIAQDKLAAAGELELVQI